MPYVALTVLGCLSDEQAVPWQSPEVCLHSLIAYNQAGPARNTLLRVLPQYNTVQENTTVQNNDNKGGVSVRSPCQVLSLPLT